MMKARNKTSDGIDVTSELALIRKIAIIALFSDDVLLEHLVLKGGNAILCGSLKPARDE